MTARPAKARITTGIRFPVELHAELWQAAADRDMTVNQLVVEAVRDFLPRLIPADELTLVRPAADRPAASLPAGPVERLRAGLDDLTANVSKEPPT